MDAGKLDQSITIQQRSVTTNDFGEEVETWTTFLEPWAEVREFAGREFLKGGIQAEGKAVFRIRWEPGVDSTMRVLWGDRAYGVEDANGTERDGSLWLHCRSISGEN